MAFEDNKQKVQKFFQCLDWKDHEDFAHDFIHPEYPKWRDMEYLSGSRVSGMSVKAFTKGPKGWLKRNTKRLPKHEVITIQGSEDTIIAEYLVTIDPADDFIEGLPDNFEPFKIIGYHTFNFSEGKVISLRTVWDMMVIKLKFPEWGPNRKNFLLNYIKKVRGLEEQFL